MADGPILHIPNRQVNANDIADPLDYGQADASDFANPGRGKSRDFGNICPVAARGERLDYGLNNNCRPTRKATRDCPFSTFMFENSRREAKMRTIGKLRLQL